MSKVLVTESHLEDIADAIREQNGTENTYNPGQMAAAIRALEGGGESVDISGKADKVSNATSGNFAALDSNGNLTDSGHKHSDYLTSHQDITGKADKPTIATSGNLAMFDGSRNPVDSGLAASSIAPPVWEYDGVDLSTKFASEISSYTDVWAWLKARLTNHNLAGIHVKDYISVTCTNGYTFKAQVAGINPYLHYGSPELTAWHIDFISKDLWPVRHTWNKKDFNNGINSNNQYPWLCCDLYYYLNSASGDVPNGTTANVATTAVNYASSGVFDKLPTALQSVIVEKQVLLSKRYTANALLTDDNSWGWANAGKLWIPSEVEVYGFLARGTRAYSLGAFAQYPLFQDQKARIKGLDDGGTREYWWLLTPNSGNSTHVCTISNDGGFMYYTTTNQWVGFPVCFRVAGSASS